MNFFYLTFVDFIVLYIILHKFSLQIEIESLLQEQYSKSERKAKSKRQDDNRNLIWNESFFFSCW